MTKTSDTIDFDAIRAKRIAMIETAAELQESEQAAIPLAAAYLAGPEVEALIAKLLEFEGVSQINSPFVQELTNTRATLEHLRLQIGTAAQMIERQKAASATDYTPPAA